jgi:hypothetical protein
MSQRGKYIINNVAQGPIQISTPEVTSPIAADKAGKSEGMSIDGKKCGIWQYYWQNGLLRCHGQFEEDVMVGEWQWFRENGAPLRTGTFVNGVRQGLWRRFQLDGALYDEGWFYGNRRVGEWKIYHRDGRLKFVRSYGRWPTSMGNSDPDVEYPTADKVGHPRVFRT